MRLILRALIYATVILAILAPWIVWQTDPNMARRGMYHVEGRLAAWSTHCDADAPAWLHSLARELTVRDSSPANQLAFVTSGGHVTVCTNGWQGAPFLTPRVTQETPMRLASLSKIVSFMALLGPDDASWDAWLGSHLMPALGLAGQSTDPRLEQVAVRHLLNHSSGFDRQKSGDPIATLGKKPWCPHEPARLATLMLDYTPGTRQSYHNLGYCLAVLAYERHFGTTPWQWLENDRRMADYGLDYLERRDSPVQYNFMNQDQLLGTTGIAPDFVQRLDWEAARAPMGMTGNARGLARFIHVHRDRLQFAQAMRDDAIPCNEAKVDSCFDGFLNRFQVGEKRFWRQRGYLYGMAASFLLDESGNYIVWLGSGEGRPLDRAHLRIEQALLQAGEASKQGEHANDSRSDNT